MNTRNLSKKYAIRHNTYSQRVRRTFLAALNRQVGGVKQAAKDGDLAGLQSAIEGIRPDAIQSAMHASYKATVLAEGQITLNELQSQIQQKGLFDAGSNRTDWMDKLKEWINTYAGDKVKSITETTKRRLRELLEETYSDDGTLSNQERAYLIYKELSDPAYNYQRALVIARTETTTAANLGHSIAADTVSGRLNMRLQKKWIATYDNRTRDTHRQMLDYPAIGQDELFVVGSSFMQQPGDTSASAKEVVNCRCRVIYQVVRGLDGRILPR